MKLTELNNKVRSEYLCSFISEADINKYLARFEKNFNTLTKKTYLDYYKWMVRSYKCSKHIIASTTFFAQSEHLGKGSMMNLTSYSMYYSLHHAVSSILVLLPHISYSNLLRISHQKCLTYAKTELSDNGIMPDKFQNFYNDVITLREVYSYRTPLGSLNGNQYEDIPEIQEIFEEFIQYLPALIQLANILSIALYEISLKHFKDVTDEYQDNQEECDALFFNTIEIKDRLKKLNAVDNSDYTRFGWVYRKMDYPYIQSWVLTEKFCEDLECGWWDKSSENDFNISTVGEIISDWLE